MSSKLNASPLFLTTFALVGAFTFNTVSSVMTRMTHLQPPEPVIVMGEATPISEAEEQPPIPAPDTAKPRLNMDINVVDITFNILFLAVSLASLFLQILSMRGKKP